MELGARSGIVSQGDDEVESQEQGEEEDLDNDPELEEQHESDEEHNHDRSDTEVFPSAIPREPEEELNPTNANEVNLTPDEPLPTHTAESHAMDTGLDGAGNFHASEVVTLNSDYSPVQDAADIDGVDGQDSDLFGENQLYDPFSRPEGEVVVQVFPTSRLPSRSPHCKRHRSV